MFHNPNYSADSTVKIPDEIIQCAEKLKNYSKTHRHSDIHSHKLWSLNGVGMVDDYWQRIYLLEGRLVHVEEAWIKSNELREQLKFKHELLRHACERLTEDFSDKDQQEALQALLERLKASN